MKKLFFLFIIQHLSFTIFAQSISLNPNFLQVPRLAVSPTCAVADKGKLIYNTTDDKLLYCNGTTWISPIATPAPALYNIAGKIATSIPFGGIYAPWTQAGPSVTVTVNGGQTIIANMVGVFGHTSVDPQSVSFCTCYQRQNPSGVITPFNEGAFMDATVAAAPNRTLLSTDALVKPSAGTYRIFFCIKNTSSVNFNVNDYVNGTVIVY